MCGCAGDDRWVAIAATSEDEWVALCGAIGRGRLDADERFATVDGRPGHAGELDAAIEQWTRSRDPWEVVRTLQAAGAPSGVVEDMEDTLTRDPHLRERHLHDLPGHDDGVNSVTHSQPARFDGRSPELKRPLLMGEYNDEVLRGLLEISDGRYAELPVSGVIY